LWPARMALPTEDGNFAELCDKATGYVGDLVEVALETSTPPAIARVLAGATADLTKADSAWFCGDGSAKPPSTSIRQKQQRPVLPSRKACVDYAVDDPGYAAEQHCALCGLAEHDEVASRHDVTSGACVREYTGAERVELARIQCPSDPDGVLAELDRSRRDCGRDGAYEQRAALARTQCRPDGKRRLAAFEWLQREIERTYVFRKGGWRVLRSEVLPGTTQQLTRDAPPCGDAHGLSREWNAEMHAAEGDEIQALCSGEEPPSRPSFEGDELGPVRFTEVLQLFGCVEKTAMTRSVASDARDSQASPAEKTPQRLAAGAELGSDDFQIRAAVLGAAPPQDARAMLQLARWQPASAPAAAEAAFAASAREASRSALAQAEYYYEVEDPSADERSGFLWNMRWTARLRRFRLPEHATAPGADDVSSGAAGDDASRFGLSAAPRDAHSACIDARAKAESGGSALPACETIGPPAGDLLIH
jgi:hypothetical protein